MITHELYVMMCRFRSLAYSITQITRELDLDGRPRFQESLSTVPGPGEERKVIKEVTDPRDSGAPEGDPEGRATEKPEHIQSEAPRPLHHEDKLPGHPRVSIPGAANQPRPELSHDPSGPDRDEDRRSDPDSVVPPPGTEPRHDAFDPLQRLIPNPVDDVVKGQPSTPGFP